MRRMSDEYGIFGLLLKPVQCVLRRTIQTQLESPWAEKDILRERERVSLITKSTTAAKCKKNTLQILITLFARATRQNC